MTGNCGHPGSNLHPTCTGGATNVPITKRAASVQLVTENIVMPKWLSQSYLGWDCAVTGATHLRLQADRTIHVPSSFVPFMNWKTLFGDKIYARIQVWLTPERIY
jgi:hypothetical protein